MIGTVALLVFAVFAVFVFVRNEMINDKIAARTPNYRYIAWLEAQAALPQARVRPGVCSLMSVRGGLHSTMSVLACAACHPVSVDQGEFVPCREHERLFV